MDFVGAGADFLRFAVACSLSTQTAAVKGGPFAHRHMLQGPTAAWGAFCPIPVAPTLAPTPLCFSAFRQLPALI